MSQLRIGEMARLGGVSVRMLRHYHEIELLVPDNVDPGTGYRLYGAAQVAHLRQIVALKEVGVALADVAGALVEADPDAIRFALGARRLALGVEITRACEAIDTIDQQLTELGRTPTMSTSIDDLEVEIKTLPARLVAQARAVAESWAPEHIGPVIQPLYPELMARVEAAGAAIGGQTTAWYCDTDAGLVNVNATVELMARPTSPAESWGFEVVELPAIEKAATTVHRGTTQDLDPTYEALQAWVRAHGHEADGYSREQDIECGPGNAWVVELQQPICT